MNTAYCEEAYRTRTACMWSRGDTLVNYVEEMESRTQNRVDYASAGTSVSFK
jgi:hypothetical protein